MTLTVKNGGIELVSQETGDTIKLYGVYTTQPDAFQQMSFDYVPIEGLDHVNLGLSVEWATINYYDTSGNMFPWQSTDIVSRNWGLYGNWRMPTKDELEELLNGCDWEKVSNEEGLNGFWVINRSDETKKIFLPLAGRKSNQYEDAFRAGKSGYYWSSDEYIDDTKGHYMLLDPEKELTGEPYQLDEEKKTYYMAIRPVWANTTVKLTASQVERTYNSATIEIKVDGEEEDYNTIQRIEVVCNDKEKDYPLARTIRAIFDGLEADTSYLYTVTAMLSKGESVSFRSTVKTDTIPEVLNDSCPVPSHPVDLGLPSGIKWSPWNMGAKSPTDYGRYCGWGDKTGWYKELNRSYYADGKDILNIATTEYDIATYQWEGQWRMPTIADFEELYKYCPPKMVQIREQTVLVFKNQNPQLSQDSIIVPLVGYRSPTTHEVLDTGKVTHNFYWTAEAAGTNPYRITLGTALTESSIGAKPRYELFAVRPVYGPVVDGGSGLPDDDDPLPSTPAWMEVAKVVEDANGYETAVPADGVDLGLPSGTKWAAWNVGAMEFGEVGKYYAWGEIAARETFAIDNYESKYNGTTCYGLPPEDDLATVLWGDDWQVPAPEDFFELFEINAISGEYRYVDVKWLNPSEALEEGLVKLENYLPGYKISSKANPNNYIFLPAGGFKHTVMSNNNPPKGYYWSNSGSALTGRTTTDSDNLQFEEELKPESTYPYQRFLGCTVRPVKHKK